MNEKLNLVEILGGLITINKWKKITIRYNNLKKIYKWLKKHIKCLYGISKKYDK